MPRKAGCLFLLFLITIQIISPGRVVAQNELPPGVDIVFVIDQSGSMIKGPILDADSGLRGPPSDPDNLAIQAVRDGMDVIIAHIYQRELERDAYGMIEHMYRFGLIRFGGSESRNAADNTQILADLTPIEIHTDEEGDLESNIEDLIPDPDEAVNLGETAFSHAFDAACRVLNCTAPPTPGRKRVVILLTDGQPSHDKFAYNWQNPASYFSSLQREHADLFTVEETKIWVVGLDKNDQFWSRNQPYWADIASLEHTSRLIGASDIAGKFRDIAWDAIGESPDPPQPCEQSFIVDPYLGTLMLSLDYPDTDSVAQFLLPNGELLEQGDKVTRSRSVQSETFIVQDPMAGEWTCEVIKGVSAKFRTIEGKFQFVNVEVESPSSSAEGQSIPVPSTCHDFGLSIQYKDGESEPIKELEDHPLDQWAELTIDGKKQRRELIRDPDRPTYWVTKENERFTPGQKGGEYPLFLEVKLEHSGTTVFTTEQSITIDPRLPCIRPLAPEPESTSVMHNRLTPVGLSVAVELTQGGEPGTPEGVFQEEITGIVTGTIEGPQGYKNTFYLEPDSEQPGRFVKYLGSEELPEDGNYTFIARVKATTQDNKPYQVSTGSVPFERVPGPWKRNLELGQRIVSSLAILAALAAVGFFAFLVTGPFPRGSLLLEEKATGAVGRVREWDEIRTISLKKMKLFGLFPTRWPSLNLNLKSIGLRKIKVRRISKGNRDGVKVILVRGRDAKKTSSKATEELEFTRPGEQKKFDSGKYRITYEDYSRGI